jgi:hypothetical protein
LNKIQSRWSRVPDIISGSDFQLLSGLRKENQIGDETSRFKSNPSMNFHIQGKVGITFSLPTAVEERENANVQGFPSIPKKEIEIHSTENREKISISKVEEELKKNKKDKERKKWI